MEWLHSSLQASFGSSSQPIKSAHQVNIELMFGIELSTRPV
jgi:hypothetical protein